MGAARGSPATMSEVSPGRGRWVHSWASPSGGRVHLLPAPGDSSLWPTASWSSSSPAFPQRELSVVGSQVQRAHWQEETGSERCSDWPQATQPACDGGKPFKPGLLPLGWSLGMSSTCSKSSESCQHFPDALKPGLTVRLGQLLSVLLQGSAGPPLGLPLS